MSSVIGLTEEKSHTPPRVRPKQGGSRGQRLIKRSPNERPRVDRARKPGMGRNVRGQRQTNPLPTIAVAESNATAAPVAATEDAVRYKHVVHLFKGLTENQMELLRWTFPDIKLCQDDTRNGGHPYTRAVTTCLQVYARAAVLAKKPSRIVDVGGFTNQVKAFKSFANRVLVMNPLKRGLDKCMQDTDVIDPAWGCHHGIGDECTCYASTYPYGPFLTKEAEEVFRGAKVAYCSHAAYYFTPEDFGEWMAANGITFATIVMTDFRGAVGSFSLGEGEFHRMLVGGKEWVDCTYHNNPVAFRHASGTAWFSRDSAKVLNNDKYRSINWHWVRYESESRQGYAQVVLSTQPCDAAAPQPIVKRLYESVHGAVVNGRQRLYLLHADGAMVEVPDEVLHEVAIKMALRDRELDANVFLNQLRIILKTRLPASASFGAGDLCTYIMTAYFKNTRDIESYVDARANQPWTLWLYRGFAQRTLLSNFMLSSYNRIVSVAIMIFFFAMATSLLGVVLGVIFTFLLRMQVSASGEVVIASQGEGWFITWLIAMFVILACAMRAMCRRAPCDEISRDALTPNSGVRNYARATRTSAPLAVVLRPGVRVKRCTVPLRCRVARIKAIGMGFIGLVPHVFAEDDEAELSAMTTRYLRFYHDDNNPQLKETYADVLTWVSTWRALLFPNLDTDVMSRSEFMSNYKGSRLHRYERAFKSIDQRGLTRQDMLRKLFIKLEPQFGKDPAQIGHPLEPTEPRLVSGTSDQSQAYFGPYIRSYQRALCEVWNGRNTDIVFMAAHNPDECLHEFITYGCLWMDGDGARWDAHTTRNPLTLAAYIYADIFRMPKVTLKLWWERYTTRAIGKFYTCVPGYVVNSGDPDTSLTNTLIRGVLTAYCVCRAAGWQLGSHNFKCAVVGDDNMVSFHKAPPEGFLKRYCDLWTSLGYCEEAAICNRVSDIAFCSKMILPAILPDGTEEYRFSVLMGRILARLGWTMSHEDVTVGQKVESMAKLIAHHPVLCTLLQHRSGGEVPAYGYGAKFFDNKSEYRVAPTSLASVCDRYNISIEDAAHLCELCKQADKLALVNEPLVNHVFAVDWAGSDHNA